MGFLVDAVEVVVWLESEFAFPDSLEILTPCVEVDLFLFVTLLVAVEVLIRESMLE